MSYEVIAYQVGSTQTYRFKTREEAEECSSITFPSYSRRKATHYLSWGEGETSIGGRVPPPGCPAVVMEFDVVTEPPSKAKKKVVPKKKVASTLAEALRPPTPKKKGTPKWQYYIEGNGSFSFRTKKEALLYRDVLYDRSHLAPPLPGIVKEVGRPNSQLMWKEGGTWYGSAEGTLPSSRVKRKEVSRTSYGRQDLQMKRKDCAPSGLQMKPSEDREGLQVKPKGKSKKSLRYRLHRWGLTFKTWEEAQTYQRLKLGKDAATTEHIQEEVGEPEHQLIWAEGGVHYGSKDGLLPPSGERTFSAAFTDDSLVTKKLDLSQVEGLGLLDRRGGDGFSEISEEEADVSQVGRSQVGRSQAGRSQAGMDYLPYLLETDLRTPEDVLNWLIEYPGMDAAQASIDLQERLKRERGEALLRAAQAGSKGVEEAADITLAEEEHLFSEMVKAIEVADEASRASLDPPVEMDPPVAVEGPSEEEPSAWVGAFGFLALLGLMGKRASDPAPRKRVGVVPESEVDSGGLAGVVEVPTEGYEARYLR